MADGTINLKSPYHGNCILLATKHQKSLAIAPAFWSSLGASVLEYIVDTDQLGTFSGEVERNGSALECARKKCGLSLDKLGSNVEFALASEGSFGPHPSIPLLPVNQEILYFIDRKRDFHLHLVHWSEKTNYQMQTLSSLEELQKFAESANFPSHALILRPNNRNNKTFVFKGIDTQDSLEQAFRESVKHSSDGKVWVETDMRAHLNPTRMAVIGELAVKMGERLGTLCPKCMSPGWGCISMVKGLPCESCDQTTELIAEEIHGCVLCDHTEKKCRTDALKHAPQQNCCWCNP